MLISFQHLGQENAPTKPILSLNFLIQHEILWLKKEIIIHNHLNYLCFQNPNHTHTKFKLAMLSQLWEKTRPVFNCLPGIPHRRPAEHWWGQSLWWAPETQRHGGTVLSPCPHHHSRPPRRSCPPAWCLWHAWCRQSGTHGTRTGCQICSGRRQEILFFFKLLLLFFSYLNFHLFIVKLWVSF